MSLQQINGTLVQVSPASAEAEVAEFKRCKRVFAKGPPRSLATVKAEALAWVGPDDDQPFAAWCASARDYYVAEMRLAKFAAYKTSGVFDAESLSAPKEPAIVEP